MASTLNCSDLNVKVEVFFGSIVVASRLRPEGKRFIGEGRTWHYDQKGNLVKDTGWEPTGAILYV